MDEFNPEKYIPEGLLDRYKRNLRTIFNVKGIRMRRMRIIQWKYPESNELGFTLVMEWFEDGKIVKDWRYQMDHAEFLALKESVNEESPYIEGPPPQKYLVIWAYKSGTVRCCSVGSLESAKAARKRLLNQEDVRHCRVALELISTADEV